MLSKLLFVTSQLVATLAVVLLTAILYDRGLHNTIHFYELNRSRGLPLGEILPYLIDLPGSLRELLSSKHVLAQSTALSIWSGVWLAARRYIRAPWFQRLAGRGTASTFDRALGAFAVTLVVGYVWVTGLLVASSECHLGRFGLWSLFRYPRPGFTVAVMALLALLGLMAHSVFAWRTSLSLDAQEQDLRWNRAALTVLLAMPVLCMWIGRAPGAGQFAFWGIVGWQGWLAVFAATVIAALHAWESRSWWASIATAAVITCIPVLLGLWLPRQLPTWAVDQLAGFDMRPAQAPVGAMATLLTLGVVLIWLVGQYTRKVAACGDGNCSPLSAMLRDLDLHAAVSRRAVTLLAAPAVGLTFAMTIGNLRFGGIKSTFSGGTHGVLGSVLEVGTPLLILLAVVVAEGFRKRDVQALQCGFMLWCLAVLQAFLVVMFWDEGRPSLAVLGVLGVPTLVCGVSVYSVGTLLLDRLRPPDATPLDHQVRLAGVNVGLLTAWGCLLIAHAELAHGVTAILPWIGVGISACTVIAAAVDGQISSGKKAFSFLASAAAVAAFLGLAGFGLPVDSWPQLTRISFATANIPLVASWCVLAMRRQRFPEKQPRES